MIFDMAASLFICATLLLDAASMVGLTAGMISADAQWHAYDVPLWMDRALFRKNGSTCTWAVLETQDL